MTSTKTTALVPTASYLFTVAQLHDACNLAHRKATALAPSFGGADTDALSLVASAKGPRQAKAAEYRRLAEVCNYLTADDSYNDLPLAAVVEVSPSLVTPYGPVRADLLAVLAQGVEAHR